MDGITQENIFAGGVGSPVQRFFEFLTAFWQALPLAVQLLISMILGIAVFFGLLNMLRT